MTPDLIITKETDKGYILSIKPKYITKYWCWAYKSEKVAEHIKQLIIDRWTDCPVKKFEDYTKTFVSNLTDIVPTSISIDQIVTDWTVDGIDIQQISGK